MSKKARSTTLSCLTGNDCIVGISVPALMLLVILLGLSPRAEPAEWTPVTGKVMFGDTPLCAMVLANGQNMFSCRGDGSFELNVPLDNSGMVTLQVFASGFAPFRQSMLPAQLNNYTVNMVRSDSDRQPTVNPSFSAGKTGRSFINGSISEEKTPICALVLANGQSMFSCNENLGLFNLDVPLDTNGEITLQIFVSGFQPYRTTFTKGTEVGGSDIGRDYLVGAEYIDSKDNIISAYFYNELGEYSDITFSESDLALEPVPDGWQVVTPNFIKVEFPETITESTQVYIKIQSQPRPNRVVEYDQQFDVYGLYPFDNSNEEFILLRVNPFRHSFYFALAVEN